MFRDIHQRPFEDWIFSDVWLSRNVLNPKSMLRKRLFFPPCFKSGWSMMSSGEPLLSLVPIHQRSKRWSSDKENNLICFSKRQHTKWCRDYQFTPWIVKSHLDIFRNAIFFWCEILGDLGISIAVEDVHCHWNSLRISIFPEFPWMIWAELMSVPSNRIPAAVWAAERPDTTAAGTPMPFRGSGGKVWAMSAVCETDSKHTSFNHEYKYNI